MVMDGHGWGSAAANVLSTSGNCYCIATKVKTKNVKNAAPHCVIRYNGQRMYSCGFDVACAAKGVVLIRCHIK